MQIRSAGAEDVESLTTLCAELGYPTSAEDVAQRLARMRASAQDAVFVAEDADGSIVGWIHVFGALRLESQPFAELGGLVVAAAHRRRGVGKLLCERASQWASHGGFRALRVRTRVERQDAHRFYRRLGFSRTKTQQIFSQQLTDR